MITSQCLRLSIRSRWLTQSAQCRTAQQLPPRTRRLATKAEHGTRAASKAYPIPAISAALAAAIVGGAAVAVGRPTLEAETLPTPVEIVFEPERKKKTSREENRDEISSQHVQVKHSWEHPGVYAWGSNVGGVVAPGSTEAFIKAPRRIPFFDGKVLRDIKLDTKAGAAVAENGDLLQWGAAFSKDINEPTLTLRGKNIVKIELSENRILALSSNGLVYSVPVALEKQQMHPDTRWFSWMGYPTIGARSIAPKALGWGEKVIDISSGLEHCLMLTTKGRVFAFATGSVKFPSRGQMGVPGLRWDTQPKGPYDQAHEITDLRGFPITKIATGDLHSLVLDKHGRVFAFGSNDMGQLGLEFSPDSPTVDTPTQVPIKQAYRSTNKTAQVTNIAAGGMTSFLAVEATKISSDETPRGGVTADVWAFGQGIVGSLGNGHWTHMQDTPVKVKALSGLSEYDEKKNEVVPIRLSRITVGGAHAAVVLGNQTHVTASSSSPLNDTNYGSDVLVWGGNEFFQLGTGKRSNVCVPQYIAPIDKPRTDEHRFQITPKMTVKVGGSRKTFEQRIECGRTATAVYSAAT